MSTRLRIEVLDHAPKPMATAFSQRQGYHEDLTPVVAQRMGVDPTQDMRPALIVGASLSAMYVAIWHWLNRSAADSLRAVVVEALQATAAGLTAITGDWQPEASAPKPRRTAGRGKDAS